jgi:O-acetylhomoserine/O-acetylserine sulfhydrylase-like pyridoxal-dependent enzyme
LQKRVFNECANLGPVRLSAKTSAVFAGLETLPLRLPSKANNALKLALWLKEHPRSSDVISPAFPKTPRT